MMIELKNSIQSFNITQSCRKISDLEDRVLEIIQRHKKN